MALSGNSPTTRVLLVEDSDTDALLFQAHLNKADADFLVLREKSLSGGLDCLDRGDVDVVLLDLNLPDSNGLESFRALHRRALYVPIVVLSGHDDVDLAVEAVSLGAQDYLPKNEANRSSLARSVRYAIERSRRQRAEQELTAAGEIQRRLFPQAPPELPCYDIFGRCEPVNSAGGDYFDFFPMPDGHLGIVVADVSGHGIGPALIMSETRAILRTLATNCDDVGHMLTLANEVLSGDLHNNVFVALLLVCLEPQEGLIHFASAGHPAIVLDEDGAVKDRICSTDPPLGIVEDRQFTTVSDLRITSGDMLLLYTDGIIECFSPDEEQFGERRLIESVAAHPKHTSRETVDSIFAEVHRFSGEGIPRDDMTAVIVKVKKSAE